MLLVKSVCQSIKVNVSKSNYSALFDFSMIYSLDLIDLLRTCCMPSITLLPVAFTSMSIRGIPFIKPKRSVRIGCISPVIQNWEAKKKSLFSGLSKSIIFTVRSSISPFSFRTLTLTPFLGSGSKLLKTYAQDSLYIFLK